MTDNDDDMIIVQYTWNMSSGQLYIVMLCRPEI